MKLPIVLFVDGSVELAATVEQAESYVEHYEVDSGRAIAFGAEGELLALHVIHDAGPILKLGRFAFGSVEFKRTKITSTGKHQPERLQEVVRGWVASVGPERWGIDPLDAAQASLNELIEMASKIQGTSIRDDRR